MSDLDFLDELQKTENASVQMQSAGPNTSVTEQAQSVNSTSDTSTPSPSSVDNGSNGDVSGNSDSTDSGDSESKPKYTNIVETREEGNDEGLMTISEFANQLTVKNITEKNLGADGVVDKSAVYAAMRAVRHPLPVVLVGDAALLPSAAFEAWDTRPTRGEGASGTTGGRLSDEDLFKAADVARTKRDALVKRLEGLQARIKQAENLYTKRDRQLSERFGTDGWTKVDEWVSANTAEIADDEKDSDANA